MGVEKWAVEGVVECVFAAKDKTDAVDLLVVRSWHVSADVSACSVNEAYTIQCLSYG